MTYEDFLDSIAESAKRVAGAFELMARAIERDKGAKTKAGKAKKDLPFITGFIKKYYGKNNYGFYNFYIDDLKFGTKSGEIGEIAKDAYEQDAEVTIYYVQKDDGKYVNRYPESIEIVDPTKRKQRAAPELPPEDDSSGEETPF